MWISKEEYNLLKDMEKNVTKLECAKLEFKIALGECREVADVANQKCVEMLEELYEIKKDLEYYLNTNEEKGVVYVPKFVVEKIVYGM